MGQDPEITVFRTNRPGIRKVLGDLEAEIMEVIWARPDDHGTTVRDVFEVLYARRSLSYTTVMTTMARLARTRLLSAEIPPDAPRNAYVYYPTSSKEMFVSRFVGRVLEDLLVSFSGATWQRLATLTDPEAAAKVRQLLDEVARRRSLDEDE